MNELPLYDVPGEPEESGDRHGRMLEDLLTPPFVEAYLASLAESNGFTRDDLSVQAERWLEALPERYQAEMAGMGTGSGLGTRRVTEFLFADIARATPTPSAAREEPGGRGTDHTLIGGPMCSGIAARLDDGHTWIARNCDWLVPTLRRGTAAVAHAVPHRIPILAVGIRGDIDVDTGINAEGLWLHLHTLPALDDPPLDRTCISWLFWAREALETCATLDELERFIETTARDRGVLVFAGEGPRNDAAVFECGKATHIRRGVDPAQPLFATNHTLSKEIDAERESRSRAGSTVGRWCALRAHLANAPPREGPQDLIRLLAAPDVEMRTPRWLRTIYSAVVRPSDGSLWFAAGDTSGRPAASSGRWTRVKTPWSVG